MLLRNLLIPTVAVCALEEDASSSAAQGPRCLKTVAMWTMLKPSTFVLVGVRCINPGFPSDATPLIICAVLLGGFELTGGQSKATWLTNPA